MMLINIRKARLKDIPRMVEIENHSFTYDLLTERNFKHHIQKANGLIMVITIAEEVIGYASVLFRKGSDGAGLYSIAIHPDYRRFGYSRMLMNYLIVRLRRLGKKTFRLEVREGNDNAIRLYESLGFERSKILFDYYDDGSTAFRYRKAL